MMRFPHSHPTATAPVTQLQPNAENRSAILLDKQPSRLIMCQSSCRSKVSTITPVAQGRQIEFASDEVDDGGKGAVGSIAAGFGLGGLDKAVDAFEDSVVDTGGEPAEDAILMAADGFREIDDGRDAAVDGPEVPLVKEWFCLAGGLPVEVLEGEADLISAGGFQMRVGDV